MDNSALHFVTYKQNPLYLLIISESSHDRRVHDAVEKHREGVDGKRGVTEVTLNHVVDFLIGQLHGLHGVFYRTDLFLQKKTQKLYQTPLPTSQTWNVITFRHPTATHGRLGELF